MASRWFAPSMLSARARRGACSAREARPLAEVCSAANDRPSALNESSSVVSIDRSRCVSTLGAVAANLVG